MEPEQTTQGETQVENNLSQQPKTKSKKLIPGLVIIFIMGLLAWNFITTNTYLGFIPYDNIDVIDVYIEVEKSPRVTLYTFSPTGCRSGMIVSKSKYNENSLIIDIKGIRYTGPQEYCDMMVKIYGNIDIDKDWLQWEEDGVPYRHVIINNGLGVIREYIISNHGTSTVVNKI